MPIHAENHIAFYSDLNHYRLERNHNLCTMVAAVTEPCGSVVSGNGFEVIGDGLIKCLLGSCLCLAQELLESGPGLLDGIQVRRVGWQIE
jgi:hypothetical protein